MVFQILQQSDPSKYPPCYSFETTASNLDQEYIIDGEIPIEGDGHITQEVLKSNNSGAEDAAKTVEKPRLAQPSAYVLCYMLDKHSINAEAQSYANTRDDIESNQREIDEANKKRHAELQESIKKERSSHKWGIAVQVFSWISSILGIVAGVALMMSGQVAGMLLIVGGVITLSNQIMNVTGGWDKIAEILPGDNPDKKRAVIAWIQIGVTILSLILSAAGLIFGGMGAMGDTMKTFMQAFGGITQCAMGVSTIGKGITDYQLRNRYAKSTMYQTLAEDYKLTQEELSKRLEELIHNLGKIYESIHKNLGLQNDTFHAQQSIYH